jgi:hypothetical protein
MGLWDEFYSWVILPRTHSTGGWVGPTAHLNALEERKLLSPLGVKPQFPGCQTFSLVTILNVLYQPLAVKVKYLTVL